MSKERAKFFLLKYQNLLEKIYLSHPKTFKTIIFKCSTNELNALCFIFKKVFEGIIPITKKTRIKIRNQRKMRLFREELRRISTLNKPEMIRLLLETSKYYGEMLHHVFQK